MEKRVYFDHAATTPTHPEVVEAMMPYFTQSFGNPSSIYEIAQINKKAIDSAREQVAKLIHADPMEIYFTSGATEADNWAIKGIAESYKKKGNHIITTTTEHHAVLHTCEYLEKQGYEVTYLPVDEYGVVHIEDLKAAIKDTTILITIMMANNEIGTVQSVGEIGALAREKGILFHTDAVQAVGQIPVDVKDMHIDLLSISGHKLNGPKGIGALYVKKGVRLKAFIHGGAQERRRRGGTENVPGIVGLGKAMEIAGSHMEAKAKSLIALRDKLIDGIKEKVPYCKLNGHPEQRLPNNVNYSFEFIEGESLLIMLDMKGISASSGSACTSGSLDPSHVLLGIGLPHEIAHGSLRITLGMHSSEEDVDYLLEVLPSIVQRLRDMSPLYEDFVKKQG
ncbi:cysteine desulfurase NifS [Vallitalea pronyensis]|uniref:Cysteine desulfurase IscS n=1 Tax=Vallitalea pronyensis TaxID=1348613 RepID=A0A8J8MLZ9_9FIRM|nr:cysteine desulfurase NifS [Vallitalea pronyensis]QUI24135.1 cysteine desulfurase NifS [Vallitalea pronyensis]